MKHGKPQDIAALSALLRELGLPATLLSPLLAHATAVREEADRLGLVALSDVSEIVARHTADSLLFALVRAPRDGERWVDVGTGAGFPGLVLAVCFPGTEFTLLEPQSRRAGFLELQTLRLGCENVVVSGARAESVASGFDVAVARALAEPALAMEALGRLIGPHGTAMLAVGESAHPWPGVDEVEVRRRGVDSPGRFFMMAQTLGEA